MTEQYLTVRDGYISAEVLIGRAKSRTHVPAYARASAPVRKGLTGLELWNAIDGMVGRIATRTH